MYQIIATKWGFDASGQSIKLPILVADSSERALPSDLPVGSECNYSDGRVEIYFGKGKWVLKNAGQIAPVYKKTVNYTGTVTLSPGTFYGGTATGSCTISLAGKIDYIDQEWSFAITQNDTAYTVTLPEIRWGFGIAPVFGANSTTVCRLYKVGKWLCGEWVTI